MRLLGILFLILAATIGSAPAFAASTPQTPLAALTYIEDNAENVADGSVAGTLANTVARRVAADWQTLRTTLSNGGADEKTLKDVDAVGLAAKAGDWVKVSAAASGLDKTWAEVRPTIIAHKGTAAAQKFDAALDGVRSSTQRRDADAASKAAAAAGDAVDGLEGVFGG